MRHVPEKIQSIVENVVTAMGYELVGIEYHAQQRHGLLRVYIDAEGGIQLDDCSRVSHQLSGVLDVEDPISSQYTLEISSPGLDRPLFKAEDFARFSGNRIRIKMAIPVQGRKNFTGVLQGVQDEDVVLDADGKEVRLALSQIDQARLVPEF